MRSLVSRHCRRYSVISIISFILVGLSLAWAGDAWSLDEFGYNPGRLTPPPGTESQRVWIHNVAGGDILGSHDGGHTWIKLGKVISPIRGGIWWPTIQGGVLAFNFERGDSQIFASAVNAIHLRFSDPQGYTLPSNMDLPLIAPQAVSIMPMDSTTSSGSDEDSSRIAITDIKPGTSLFGPEWSPKVGSKVLMGDGVTFKPISYGKGPNSSVANRSYIQIITEEMHPEVEYLEFENRAEGKVMMKRQGEVAFQVAKVKKPVTGIGRFEGSEFVQQVGAIRANHPGVICVSTTDMALDPTLPNPIPKDQLNDLRGGFQIVPSHHYQDSSMQNGSGHGEVYMVVGPIKDPPHLKRYDMGIDGSYPLFRQNLRAGTAHTYFKFIDDDKWYELSDALAQGKFKRKDGTVMVHLRGYVGDALSQVTHILIGTSSPATTTATSY